MSSKILGVAPRTEADSIMPINTHAGRITDHVHLIDTLQFGKPAVTAAFLVWDGRTGLVMDTGTSDNAPAVADAIARLGVPLGSVAGITGTHYHFDHMGGASALARIMRAHNPSFSIFAPADMKARLQDAEEHLAGARTTFGDFVGTMDPAPEECFTIVAKDAALPIDFDGGISVTLMATPGHCPDHCSPAVRSDGRTEFVFAGEACGTLFHDSELVSSATSMPPNFSFERYMAGVETIRALDPGAVGLCHFGAVTGARDVTEYIARHRDYIRTFRELIITAHAESPELRHILRATRDYFARSFDPAREIPEAFIGNLQLALTYGMLVDLGLREPKYEKRLPEADA